METSPPSSWRRLLPGLGVLVVLAGLVALYRFDPATHGFFPRCQFRLLTGWDCPGCGATRAGYQLLHGHWQQAWQLNPLFVIALPAGLLWGLYQLRQKWTGRNPIPFTLSPPWVWTLAVAVIIFTVLRNLPGARR